VDSQRVSPSCSTAYRNRPEKSAVALGGIMRRRGFVIGLVLLPAVAVQAINTITTLNERSWVPAQQTLTGDIGPLNENADTLVRQTREGTSLFDNGPLPSLLSYPQLSLFLSIDSDGSEGGSRTTEGNTSEMPLTDTMGPAMSLFDETRWIPDAKEYADASLNTADSEPLPTFDEIDWMAAPLPAANRISIMEIMVFPALGVLVAASVLGMLIVHVRRRRPARRTRQLLQV